MSEVIITILAVLFLLYAIPKGFSILGDTYRDGGIFGVIVVIGLVFLIVGFGL